LSGRLHKITHRHKSYGKEGIGYFHLCGFRGSKKCHAYFIDQWGINWYELPESIEVLREVIAAESAEEALEIVKREKCPIVSM
jgi:hypothetical protein